MNRDEMIEKAVRAMAAETYAKEEAWDVWVTDEITRDRYRRVARAALAAVDALPSEALPVGTRKRSRAGEEAILTNDPGSVSWVIYKGQPGRVGDWLTDADLADWEIITDMPNRKELTS